MSTAKKKLRHTFEEYLTLEEQSDYRSEFFRGEIYAMAGGSEEHSRIISNVNAEIRNAIFNRECSVFDGNLKIRIEAADSAVYSDGMVICDPIEFYNNRRDVVSNPCLVIEVLSDSTAAFDRGGKFRNYQLLPSLMEYVLIEQKEAQVDIFRKNREGLWVFEGYGGLDAKIEIQSLGITLQSQRIYHRVQFPESNR